MSDHHHHHHHHQFTPDMQILKQPFSALNNDPAAMEIVNPFQDLINPIGYSAELPSLNFQSSMGFCPQSFLPPEFAANLCHNFPDDGHHSLLQSEMKTKKKPAPRAANRPSMTPESSLTHSDSATKSTNSGGRRKRKKNGEEEQVQVEVEEEQQREVVHVRAKRGQATDSHSLAERVRREKINERLRCLQEIVPGCYKTMGMAVMLDEIINYVQSLQNQVEFLSLKLAAASTYYDFNSERDHTGTGTLQQRGKAYEGLKMERLQGSEELANSNPLDHTPYPHNS